MMEFKKEWKNHWVYYFILLVLEGIGLALLTLSTYNKPLQLTIVIMMTLIYIFSALVHHFLSHDVHPKIVVEYILMGCLGIALTFFLLRIII
jgi:hypothetical protein